MRCECCNRLLNDFESTRKSKTTGLYFDMCNKCYSTIEDDLEPDIRDDLLEDEVPDDEIEFHELQEDDFNFDDDDE